MPLAGNRQRVSALGEKTVEWGLFLCAAVSILTTVGIVAILAAEAIGFFRVVPILDVLTGAEWIPLFTEARYGILPLVWGTLMVAAIAGLVALPAGLMVAVYLNEFASAPLRKWAVYSMELLAGIPTVVYGYCALLLVTPFLRRIFPELGSFNALSAGLVVGWMILPMIVALSGDALRAVPDSLREGAFALGSGRLRAVFRVVVPAAASGIAASFVLAFSRALGETMIVAIAAGQFPRLGWSPLEPVQTMTAYVVQIALGDAPVGSLQYRTIFAVGAMLFATTFLLNVIGHRLLDRSGENAG